ncbi:MAG: hypothetical protein H8D56_01675 [Planctomycetes bacterium]|nr:hypothetical protein [Planctomycetota bacterium]MBL7143172.1 hypothetical protein [Phycisphaerae bacterium]
MKSIKVKPIVIIAKTAFAISLILSIISFFGCSFAGTVHYPANLSKMFCVISNIVCVLSMLCVCTGIAIIKQFHGRSTSIPFLGKLSLGVAILVCVFVIYLFSWINKRSIAVFNPGPSNMNRIAKAMLIYANDHEDNMPDPNSWCDILIDQGYVALENLCIPSFGIRWPFGGRWPFGVGNWPPKEGANITLYPGSVIIFPQPMAGHCDFAMNRNCRHFPQDGNPILLFVSKPGWNQSGGAELADMDRFGNEGILVYRASEGGTFVRKEHISKLSWEGY